MKQTIIDHRVKAKFYLSSPKLDFEMVDRLMGINATRIMLKEDIRVPEYAEDLWILETDYEISNNINGQLEKLYRTLPERNVIKNVCRQFNAECKFSIVIKMGKYDNLPGIYYEREFIKFAGDIDAEIDVDFI